MGVKNIFIKTGAYRPAATAWIIRLGIEGKVDGMTFDNQGCLIFNNNRLHELFEGDLDWEDEYNLIVWKAYLGEGFRSYLYYFE